MTPEQALEATLYRDIPLTRAMGLQVARWRDHELRLRLPLVGNTNHTGSQFGGSLYSAAVLAGWSWLLLRQQETGLADGHIVIQEGRIEYLLPAFADTEVVCPPPPEEDWARFERMYQRKGRARLSLDTVVLNPDGQPAVRFCGQYVLHR